MIEDTENGGGLSERVLRLLGFNQMCQCGHEYGLHNGVPGMECVVLDCSCGHFCPTKAACAELAAGTE